MGSAHCLRGVKTSWGPASPRKDRELGSPTTPQSHHLSSSWPSLYRKLLHLYLPKRWKKGLMQPSPIWLDSKEVEGWIYYLFSPRVFLVSQGHESPINLKVYTYILLRDGWDASLYLLFRALISFFKQILPSELSLACSQSMDSDPILYRVLYVLCIW